MTTQCTIKISTDDHSIYLDRYTDGSLAIVRADVYQAATLAYNARSPYCPYNPPHIIAANYLLSLIHPAASIVITSPSPAPWEQVPTWAITSGCMIRSLSLCAAFQPTY